MNFYNGSSDSSMPTMLDKIMMLLLLVEELKLLALDLVQPDQGCQWQLQMAIAECQQLQDNQEVPPVSEILREMEIEISLGIFGDAVEVLFVFLPFLLNPISHFKFYGENFLKLGRKKESKDPF